MADNEAAAVNKAARQRMNSRYLVKKVLNQSGLPAQTFDRPKSVVQIDSSQRAAAKNGPKTR